MLDSLIVPSETTAGKIKPHNVKIGKKGDRHQWDGIQEANEG